jgi:hypothetical protein
MAVLLERGHSQSAVARLLLAVSEGTVRYRRQFADAILRFFREILPKDWKSFRDQVSDNFRVALT